MAFLDKVQTSIFVFMWTCKRLKHCCPLFSILFHRQRVLIFDKSFESPGAKVRASDFFVVVFALRSTFLPKGGQHSISWIFGIIASYFEKKPQSLFCRLEAKKRMWKSTCFQSTLGWLCNPPKRDWIIRHHQTNLHSKAFGPFEHTFWKSKLGVLNLSLHIQKPCRKNIKEKYIRSVAEESEISVLFCPSL